MTFRTSAHLRRPLAALIGLVSLAGGATLLPVAPATSVPAPADAPCPPTAPAADLTAGQAVDGLTVASGTTPETFTGTVLGTIADGIAPGLDMIVVRLSSPQIDRVGGIWEGMSGSPVYTADGQLVGAVSYGLAYGASPVAGVTPAAAMKALLTTGPTAPTGRARPARRVGLPPSLRARAVGSGAASARAAGSGLEPLAVPVGVSGLSSARLRRVSGRLDLGGPAGVHLYRAAPAAAAPPAGGDPQVIAGGNLAASLAYGDFSAVGTGTTTMVCDGVVVGFGHPFDFTGETTLTMHGADVVYVQEDPLGVPFKVSNPTGPVGVVDEDRLAGIKGELGAAPPATLVHTAVTGPAHRSRSGDTRVSVPDFLSTATALGLLGNLDRVFDHTGRGSSSVRFAITGRTAAGAPFSVVHGNRYASGDDITYESVFEAAAAVDALEANDFTGVSIDQIRIDASLSDQVRAYRVRTVQARVRGAWRTVGPQSVVRVRHGRRIRLRVLLGSRRDELGTKVVTTSVRVPRRTPRGLVGLVDVAGAGDLGGLDGDLGDEGTADGGSGARSFGELLRSLRTAPRNDELAVSLELSDEDGSAPAVSRRVQVGSVVTGDAQFQVRVR